MTTPTSGAEPSSSPTPSEPEPPVLDRPADGVPPVVGDAAGLARCSEALAGGEGPVAIDAERAHGHRYGTEAYLLQLRRRGSGTHLVDPRAFAAADGTVDLSGLGRGVAEAEWIIHAASQDLPCLAEVGLLPQRLFDTELAGRLLNRPRVGLGPLLEAEFGVRLRKEHSAADWSTRPIPEDWLVYAALDVELLVELRDRLAAALEAAGKDGWAAEEFAALAADAGTPRPPRVDPWRRTSGMQSVRTPMAAAIVRELWTARDEIARTEDRAPSKILPDVAITELAAGAEPAPADIRRIMGFKRRRAQQHQREWVAALQRALALPATELPPLRLPPEGPPPTRTWSERYPAAAERWSRVRPAVVTLAETHDLPVENLLSPDPLRRLTWRPPASLTEESVDDVLTGFGARAWQRELVVPVVTPLLDDALTDPAVLEQAAELRGRRRRSRGSS